MPEGLVTILPEDCLYAEREPSSASDGQAMYASQQLELCLRERAASDGQAMYASQRELRRERIVW